MTVWPGGKSLAFSPIVAWEIWPPDLGTSKSHQMKSQQPNPPGAVFDRDMWVIYDHQYAERQGVDRLLRVLERYDVLGTFVTNGRRIEESAELAVRVRDAGHDMGCENYIHEYPIMQTKEEEDHSIGQTVAAFESVLGVPPTGYISPGHRPSPHTLDILLKYGLEWDADFQNDDAPFLLTAGDSRLVGMPYAHISDYPTYPGIGRTPRDVLQMLIDEFEVLLAEGKAGAARMMGFAIHPFLFHGYRSVMLSEFLKVVGDHEDVWCATRTEIADWVKEHPEEFRAETKDDALKVFDGEGVVA